MVPRIPSPRRCVLLLITLCLSLSIAGAWEWSDLVRGSGYGLSSGTAIPVETLSMQQVSELRVRDIKRRLTRNHGYSAEEVARILDKKELVQALAFEEEKIRLHAEAQAKRTLIQQGLVAAIISVFVILCWPLFQHAYEVALINLVVYTDRKKHEASRCLALSSVQGMVGILLMGVLDVLQIWLTASVILSWVMSSRYFFPVPRLTVRPAQFMGEQMAASSMADYGINIGSMLLTYGMRFLYGRVEAWTGHVLSAAHKRQRKVERQAERHAETPDEAAARRDARKAARWQKQLDQQQAASRATAMPFRAAPPPPPPPEWEQHVRARPSVASIPVSRSKAHDDFLNQLDEQVAVDVNDHDASDEADITTALDELD